MTWKQHQPVVSGGRRKVRQGESGAALVLMATALLCFMMMAYLIVGIASRSVDRSRAQAAADAAALAGAAGGRGEAEVFARANGGELTTYDRVGNSVFVVVLVDEVRAVARAERHLVAGR